MPRPAIRFGTKANSALPIQIHRQYHPPPNDRPPRLSPSPPQTLSLFTLVYPGSPLPPRWTNMKPAEKHFRCTICQRGFTRIDHLKRHHLRRMFAPPCRSPDSLLSLDRFWPKALFMRVLQRVFCALVRPPFASTPRNHVKLTPHLAITCAITIQIAVSAEIARSPKRANEAGGDMHVNR